MPQPLIPPELSEMYTIIKVTSQVALLAAGGYFTYLAQRRNQSDMADRAERSEERKADLERYVKTNERITEETNAIHARIGREAHELRDSIVEQGRELSGRIGKIRDAVIEMRTEHNHNHHKGGLHESQ